LVKQINSVTYQELLTDGTLSNGMLPKLENCFEALKRGVHRVHIGNIFMLQEENNNCTTITL
jgi:acetylglutamate kinase